MKGHFNLIKLVCGIRVQQWDMLTVSYWQKTMKVLPMLPSTETRFSLFSRLSFRGLGHALLAVGDMLSSSNVAEMYNNTRYSYSQFPDKQAGRSILALKLLVPPTGNSCVQTAGALHTTPNSSLTTCHSIRNIIWLIYYSWWQSLVYIKVRQLQNIVSHFEIRN